MANTRGFTLLEVLVALAIAGLVLGTLFSLAGGSKRLAFRALDHIESAVYSRAALNAAQLLPSSDYPKLPPEYAEKGKIETGETLPRPERETNKILYALEPYTLKLPSGATAASTRWKKLDVIQ